MNMEEIGRRGARSLALTLAEKLGERIQAGLLAPGAKLPTEAAIMEEFGVSRTVVREAISKLQANGLVETKHGIGTFVLSSARGEQFRLAGLEHLGSFLEVLSVLELRMCLEVESASMAAMRRTTSELDAIRQAHHAFGQALDAGIDTVQADVQFHTEIARATHNRYFVDLMGHLGATLIPRRRLDTLHLEGEALSSFLAKVNGEHENILTAIEMGDPESARAAMRTHLSNSRARLKKAQDSLLAAE